MRATLSERLASLAAVYFGRSVSDLMIAREHRDGGQPLEAEVRLRTGRHAGVCAAGCLELAVRHSRDP